MSRLFDYVNFAQSAPLLLTPDNMVVILPIGICLNYVSCPGPLIVKAFVSVENVVFSSRPGAVPPPPGGQNPSNISDASIGVKVGVAFWNDNYNEIKFAQ